MYNYYLLKEVVAIEARITCRYCDEELKYNFDGDEDKKTIFHCSCGKCGLKVFPREKKYIPHGEYVDNSTSVVEPLLKTYKEWRI